MFLFLESSRNHQLAALHISTVRASSIAFGHDGATKPVWVLGVVEYSKGSIFHYLNSFYSFDTTDITVAYLARLIRECPKASCSGIPIEIKKGRAGAKAK